MPKLFTDEQVELARSVRLGDYLYRYEPGNITVRERYDEIRLKDHDSFVLTISNDVFDWKSRKIGGRGALDYLVKVRNYGFKEAVFTLLPYGNINLSHGFSFSRPPPKTAKRRAFELPPKHENADAVVKYLLGRGIDGGIIDDCIADGSIYQTMFYSEKTTRSFANAVFVGFDWNGNDKGAARYACIRSTFGNFKQDAAGSNKAYNFLLPADCASRVVSVFESPIDALSGATIVKRQFGGRYRNIHRLSLGGVSDLALCKYLETFPNVNVINLCLDNDEAGQKASNGIKEMFAGLSKTYKVNDLPPKHGKDYNEMLIMEGIGRKAKDRNQLGGIE